MLLEQKVEIREAVKIRLRGDYPDVQTYDHIDAESLYHNDPEGERFHIVLPILEEGRVSQNGLLYDAELINTILEQLEEGGVGIRGHIQPGLESSAFPPYVVHWIGHYREGNITWAKGYIPPGEFREELRRIKATGGSIGTSIYVAAYREPVEGMEAEGIYRLREAELISLDMAPSKMAALRMNRGFNVVQEMSEGDKESTEVGTATDANKVVVVSVADVPDHVREQIIKEASIKADAERVKTLEAELTEAKKFQSEYAQLVASLRAYYGQDVTGESLMTAVSNTHSTMQSLRDLLGEEVNVEVAVSTMYDSLQAMEQEQFAAAVDQAVAELTNWQVSQKNSARVEALREQIKGATLARLGESRDKDKIAEAAQAAFDSMKLIVETVRDSLGGPAAIVGGKAKTDIVEQRRARLEKYLNR